MSSGLRSGAHVPARHPPSMKTGRARVSGSRSNVDPGVHPAVSAVIRYGVFIAAIVIMTGLVLLLFRRGLHAFIFMPTLRTPETTNLHSMRAILRELLPPRSEAVLETGILMLIMTPVLAVATSAMAFAITGDRLYSVIAVLVLLVRMLGFAIGGSGNGRFASSVQVSAHLIPFFFPLP